MKKILKIATHLNRVCLNLITKQASSLTLKPPQAPRNEKTALCIGLILKMCPLKKLLHEKLSR